MGKPGFLSFQTVGRLWVAPSTCWPCCYLCDPGSLWTVNPPVVTVCGDEEEARQWRPLVS